MRGSEFIARMIREMRRSAQRAGQEVSQANIDQLMAIHQKLKRGHDTMEEAMREFAAFLAEKDADDGTDDPPESADGYDDPMEGVAGAEKGAGIDTADARSRSRTRVRASAWRHPPAYPELYRTGNAPVRSGRGRRSR
jgi:hypothetical protein